VANNQIEKIKQKPNSNNDWDVSFALIYGVEDLAAIDRTNPKYTQVKEKFQELYLGGLRNFEERLIELDTLRSLVARGYRLGIATSRPREEALFVLDNLFAGVFKPEFVVALEDCEKEKPAPEPLLMAKKKMNCKNPVYIGDTINDYIAAKSAEMRFASVEKGLGNFIEINRISEVLS